MKMKSTLVVLALGASFGAMAHHTAFNTPYDARQEVNRPLAGHSAVKINNGDVATMDETSGATATGAGAIYFRYDGDSGTFGGFKTPAGESLQRAQIHICVGPKVEGSEKTTITPRLRITSKKDNKGQGKTLKMDFAFEPITLTDGVQHIVLVSEEKSGEYYEQNFCDGVTGKALKVRYYDLYFDDAEAGQFVAWEGMGFDRYEMPVLNFEHQATWEAVMTAHSYDFDGTTGNKVKTEEPGTYFIQAEDFAPDWVLGYKGHSESIQGIIANDAMDGYAGRRNFDSFWYEPGLESVHLHNGNAQMNGGNALNQAYGADHNSKHDNSQGFALLGMCQREGEMGTNYNGEYIDETSNLITKEAADKGFGSFADYVFEMEQDGYLDLSVLANPNRMGWYDVVIGGGTRANNNAYSTKYNKPRSEGGYVVDGMDDDYLKTYGFSYIIYLDGEPLRTAWSIRPTINKRTGALIPDIAMNPLEWTNCQEEVDGEMVNSTHLWLFPNYLSGEPAGGSWFPVYKDHFINRCYNVPVKIGTQENEDGSTSDVMGDSGFKKACLEQGIDYEQFLHPDYTDIKVDAGRHVIRVQSCGGATVFDELKLRAKAQPTYSAISNVIADRNEAVEDLEAAPEYFDLQGRKVVNPAGGIYIVKRGNTVTKEVIR